MGQLVHRVYAVWKQTCLNSWVPLLCEMRVSGKRQIEIISPSELQFRIPWGELSQNPPWLSPTPTSYVRIPWRGRSCIVLAHSLGGVWLFATPWTAARLWENRFWDTVTFSRKLDCELRGLVLNWCPKSALLRAHCASTFPGSLIKMQVLIWSTWAGARDLALLTGPTWILIHIQGSQTPDDTWM